MANFSRSVLRCCHILTVCDLHDAMDCWTYRVGVGIWSNHTVGLRWVDPFINLFSLLFISRSLLMCAMIKWYDSSIVFSCSRNIFQLATIHVLYKGEIINISCRHSTVYENSEITLKYLCHLSTLHRIPLIATTYSRIWSRILTRILQKPELGSS